MTPIRSDLLAGIPHGFYTRQGGVSEGRYASLNCGPGSDDDPAKVAENRARVRADIGADALVSVHQIHSATVVEADRDWDGERPKADAMVSRTPGLALGVLTADCAPVLLADPQAGVVGAAHAGWRGALGGVLGETVAAMVRLGARREGIRAAVGPCIAIRSYEVGPDFVEAFLDADRGFARFFAGAEGDRARFDLPGFCLHRLSEEGVEAGWTGHDTYADPDRFFSYRRVTHERGGDYGRLCAAVMVPA